MRAPGEVDRARSRRRRVPTTTSRFADEFAAANSTIPNPQPLRRLRALNVHEPYHRGRLKKALTKIFL